MLAKITREFTQLAIAMSEKESNRQFVIERQDGTQTLWGESEAQLHNTASRSVGGGICLCVLGKS